MVRRILTFLAALAHFGAAWAQAPGTPNEGSQLTQDAASGTYTFSWWGTASRTYFIQHSEDLMTWEYIPVIEPGVNEVAEWGFSSTGEKFFLRLKYTDVATTDPFADDFDGDHVSNYDELQEGTDPFHFADTDNDGLADDWEIKHFGNLASGPTGDADDDGLTNLQEYLYYSDPMDYGNRGGSIMFGDSDHNGLADWWEILYFGHLRNDPSQLVPAKGLTLQQIFDNDLDLAASSTTNDDIPDSWKLAHSLSTTNSNVANEDADGDGLTNGEEYAAGTDPQASDTDGDGIADGYDLHPLITDPSAPQNFQIAIPSWDEQYEAAEPDFSLVDWTTIEVRWEAATFNPTGYRIERRHDSDIWQEVATLGAGATTHADSNLVANRHYQYRVVALKNEGGQTIESPAAEASYEVPLNLRVSVKRSSLTRQKGGFAEFTNPSTPPIRYLVRTDISSLAESDSDDTWNGQRTWTQTINPSEHSRTYSGVYFHEHQFSLGNVSSDTTDTSNYTWYEQERSKLNPTRTEQGNVTSNRTYTWSNSSGSGGSSRDISGTYLFQETFLPSNPPGVWLGTDFDLSLGSMSYHGESSYTDFDTNGADYDNTTSSSAAGTDGVWTGTGTYNWKSGNQTGTSTYALSGPAWSGGWGYSGWSAALIQTTPTQRTYYTQNSAGDWQRTRSASEVLSVPYATSAFVTDTIADLPDYSGQWEDDWYGWGYYDWGYWGWNYWGDWHGYFPWGSAYWYGWWVAERHLASTEDEFTISKVKYKFKASPSAPKQLRWYEIFVPEDDPDTAEVDESKKVEVVGARTWQMTGTENESPEFEIDASGEDRNGYYSIAIEPVHMGVSGIGEAGKDVAGQDTAPGKVVLINDRDADNDGIPDFADGFDRNNQIEDDNTSYGAAFTPVGISFYASDPQNAKIRFTYDASDPTAITSSPTDPYILPATGKIRLWMKDADTARNAASVKQGGDYIVPGVEYTFEDLGITSYTYLTVYVEAVKVSGAVADIPIKVEIDPTGSLGYQWSDQLRFTNSRIEILGRGYGEQTFTSGVPLAPSDLKEFDQKFADYGTTPGGFLTYKIRVYDPRTNLATVRVADTSVSLQRNGNLWESPEFICAQPLVPIDFANAPTLRIRLTPADTTLEYNPSKIEEYVRTKKVPKLVQEVDFRVNDRQQAIKAAGWTPPVGNTNPGVFGNEVHEWVSGYYAPNNVPKKGWAVNVFVHNDTGAVLSVGQLPPGGTTNTTQIDLMAVKGSYKPTVGVPLDKSRILHVFDIKTSARIRNDEELESFVTRVARLTGQEEVHLPQVRERWSFAKGGWDTNKRVLRVAKIAKYVAALSVVTCLAEMSTVDAKVDDCIAKAVYYRGVASAGSNDSVVFPAKYDLFVAMKTLMQSFSQSPIDQLPTNLGLYWWLLDDDAAIFDHDPEYDAP